MTQTMEEEEEEELCKRRVASHNYKTLFEGCSFVLPLGFNNYYIKKMMTVTCNHSFVH